MTVPSGAAVSDTAARPVFTLTVMVTSDGFIARDPSDNPAIWASPEEQALFFSDVDAADWAIMGRHTHQVADRPDRRRIVLSSAGGGWKRPTQLWLDPAGIGPADLRAHVAHRHPMQNGLILGGTRVHDWFLAARCIDRVHLTIEPLTFGTGVPLFSNQVGADPEAILISAGFGQHSGRILNRLGTRHQVWLPAEAAGS
ncbi:dihydrofolate reductase family protein [Pseudoruegeria sp. SK021]|uniref:dihydrofolate reductase family protein n=1 Tax=Pseudoruegeria sp. SK021 TaxID=1933035 RepID=UPI000A244264|nr:dihydrofolate reductase family protein [Pseudoruegeria sp. SK021]OSP55489.1 hypothetical protein BV911_07555 [Pseudoruegeria sp. SK021]